MINLSTSSLYDRVTGQMIGLRSQAEDLQRQIASGERLSRSSDDPVAAAQLRTLSRTQRIAEIDQRNSDGARSDLQMADDALESVANAIIRGKELAMQAASGTLNQTQLAAVALEVSSLRDSLLIVANSSNTAGHALFGGQGGGSAYEMDASGTVTYVGTNVVDAADLGDGQSVPSALAGPEVFNLEKEDGSTTDLFAVLGALATALQDGSDPAAAAKDAISSLDSGLNKVATAQTLVGARLSWIELMDDRRTAVGEHIAEKQATVGGADLATAMTRLQEVMTVLEASQASFVKLSNLSLVTMLR